MKPNQPIHSMPVPMAVMVTLCGAPTDLRLPSISAQTSAAIPELMCTTVPPAKSSAPLLKMKPAWLLATSPAAASV